MTENQRIKNIRKSLNLSQEEFGNSIGLTQSAITLIESGKSKATPQTKLLIAHIYNVNMSYLENGEMPIFSDDNLVKEDTIEYRGQVSFLKNEIDKWRDKYFDLNEKYIKLLEAQVHTDPKGSNNRTA